MLGWLATRRRRERDYRDRLVRGRRCQTRTTEQAQPPRPSRAIDNQSILHGTHNSEAGHVGSSGVTPCCLPRHSGLYRASTRRFSSQKRTCVPSDRRLHNHRRMAYTTRIQRKYDHRLRQLIQNTGDLDLAVRYGAPRSTARGWLKQSRANVVSMDVIDMDAASLQQEVLRLRRRTAQLLSMVRLVVVAFASTPDQRRSSATAIVSSTAGR